MNDLDARAIELLNVYFYSGDAIYSVNKNILMLMFYLFGIVNGPLPFSYSKDKGLYSPQIAALAEEPHIKQYMAHLNDESSICDALTLNCPIYGDESIPVRSFSLTRCSADHFGKVARLISGKESEQDLKLLATTHYLIQNEIKKIDSKEVLYTIYDFDKLYETERTFLNHKIRSCIRALIQHDFL